MSDFSDPSQPKKIEYHFFAADREKLLEQLGAEGLKEAWLQMLRVREFEVRAESSYLQGKIGGFFHSYIGQEAIQTAALMALGPDHWWITSYRCHALALLLKVSPTELMAELYGKATGNAKGRGGSMHFFSERLLGGYGIVGGQIPIATGAAFTCKYLGKKEQVAVCFLGDGAVAQGAFHESLNLAALWDLPCLYVIENNQWGMGTSVARAISVDRLAEDKAAGYGLKGYTFDGMDFFSCYGGFCQAYREVLSSGKPLLIETITERFRGHSISDPVTYRSKEELKLCMQRDPIPLLQQLLLERGWMDTAEVRRREKEVKEEMVKAMDYAEASPWPDPTTIGEEVYAP